MLYSTCKGPLLDVATDRLEMQIERKVGIKGTLGPQTAHIRNLTKLMGNSVAHPQGGSSSAIFQFLYELEFGNVSFCGGRKPQAPHIRNLT